MTKRTWTIVILLAIVGLVTLGLVSSPVGGISVRSASRTYEVGTLTSSQSTLLPGVATAFTVELSIIPRNSSLLVLRMPDMMYSLREVPADQLRYGVVSVLLPCSGELYENGTLSDVRAVLIEHGSNAVLAQSAPLQVLPPGPDCLY